VVLPGRPLAPEQQIRYGSRFGELAVHPIVPHLEGHPPIIVLDSTRRENRGRTDFWHSDATFGERPPAITILHALRIPPAGGDTMFANQYLAYEGLSPGLRRMLDPLRAVHTATGLASAVGKDPGAFAPVSHPVVRTHPETGRRALFVNVAFTSHFEDMTVEESQPLLDHLYRVSVRPEITFRHRWKVGDTLMWDNRSVLHYAIPDYGSAARLMHRVIVKGDRPT
jgi:taurine dioxygenase